MVDIINGSYNGLTQMKPYIIFTKRSYQCLHRKVSSKLSDILGLLNIEEEIIDVYETENKYFIPFISRNNDFC